MVAVAACNTLEDKVLARRQQIKWWQMESKMAGTVLDIVASNKKISLNSFQSVRLGGCAAA